MKHPLLFLPGCRLYPGMELGVEVSANGGAKQIVEVPFSGSGQELTDSGFDRMAA